VTQCEHNHTFKFQASSQNRNQPVQNSRRNHRNGDALVLAPFARGEDAPTIRLLCRGLPAFAASCSTRTGCPSLRDFRGWALVREDQEIFGNRRTQAPSSDDGFHTAKRAKRATAKASRTTDWSGLRRRTPGAIRKGLAADPTRTPRTPHSGNRPRWCCPRQKKRLPCRSMPTCCAGCAASAAIRPASTPSSVPTCRRMNREANSHFQAVPQSPAFETSRAAHAPKMGNAPSVPEFQVPYFPVRMAARGRLSGRCRRAIFW